MPKKKRKVRKGKGRERGRGRGRGREEGGLTVDTNVPTLDDLSDTETEVNLSSVELFAALGEGSSVLDLDLWEKE